MFKDFITDEAGRGSQSKIMNWVVLFVALAFVARTMINGWDLGPIAALVICVLLLGLMAYTQFNRSDSRRLNLEASAKGLKVSIDKYDQETKEDK